MEPASNKPLIRESMIRNAIKMCESTNANEITMSFCKMGDFDGWCLRVTVCRHDVCEKEDKAK